jgi:hypothetical protein
MSINMSNYNNSNEISLIINRIKCEFSVDKKQKIYFSEKDNTYLFSLKYKSLLNKFSKTNDFERLVAWGNERNLSDDTNICFDFENAYIDDQIECDFIIYFKPKLIRHLLIKHLREKGNVLIEPKPKISDVNVYSYLKNLDSTWDIYRRYDLLIKGKYNELTISVGSNFTLISKENFNYKDDYNHAKYISDSGYVVSFPSIDSNSNCRVIANYKIKTAYNIPDPFNSLVFRNKYDLINSFYLDYLKGIEVNGLSFLSNGLMNVNVRDIYKVNMYENKMIFKDDKSDINPITGMRNYGIYQSSPKALSNKFLFIYENRDDANNLYRYLRNGLKNFPGLERYVGIPVTLSDIKGVLDSNSSNIIEKFNKFKDENLTEDSYENLFAIVIGHFDKNDTSEDETEGYYHIKNELLKKGIPSQFVNQENIRKSNSFNYHLPNIAIGILAKLGGIPWRLKNNISFELIIGFNQERLENKQYIGSSVFFTNEGLLKGTYAYPATESERELIAHLRTSIENYRTENNDIQRLIIHYYKPNNERETEQIERLLYEELKINIPFAIIEVNDTKTQTDICFDANYNMGIPESGIYVRLASNEYLLFNNTRYETKPIGNVKDELPIKVKIHFADTNGFSHRELIGQIYEFSRLIWKGLKQRSQPATTIYAKLIANFSAHFGGNIPNNDITKNTPWFL